MTLKKVFFDLSLISYSSKELVVCISVFSVLGSVLRIFVFELEKSESSLKYLSTSNKNSSIKKLQIRRTLNNFSDYLLVGKQIRVKKNIKKLMDGILQNKRKNFLRLVFIVLIIRYLAILLLGPNITEVSTILCRIYLPYTLKRKLASQILLVVLSTLALSLGFCVPSVGIVVPGLIMVILLKTNSQALFENGRMRYDNTSVLLPATKNRDFGLPSSTFSRAKNNELVKLDPVSEEFYSIPEIQKGIEYNMPSSQRQKIVNDVKATTDVEEVVKNLLSNPELQKIIDNGNIMPTQEFYEVIDDWLKRPELNKIADEFLETHTIEPECSELPSIQNEVKDILSIEPKSDILPSTQKLEAQKLTKNKSFKTNKRTRTLADLTSNDDKINQEETCSKDFHEIMTEIVRENKIKK